MNSQNQQPKLSLPQQPQKNTITTARQQFPQQLQQIQTKSQKCAKYCKIVTKFKFNLLTEILRTSIYLAVAFGIFVLFQKTSHITLHEQTYFSSQQVVYPSQIRGLFPPIQGSSQNLYNKWKVMFTNSLQIPTNSIFNNFTLQLKNNNIRIKRIGCYGDYLLNWEINQFNIYISQHNYSNFGNTNTDNQMYIEPDQNDIKCIKQGDGKIFFQFVTNSTVWTIYQGRLYILVEKWIQSNKNNVNGNFGNIQSILLLETI